MPKSKRKSARFRLALPRATKRVRVPEKRTRPRGAPASRIVTARPIISALKKSPGAKEFLSRNPRFAVLANYGLIATFAPCGKTGTARYLDVWDADHFDEVTDLASNLKECRIWFSADGYTTWGSGQTKTGRINCYFRAPSDGFYVCNVELRSDGGSAMVECLIDSFNYGPLGFNGAINWPHPSYLSAGYHHFRIRQKSGAFFFHRLTVWKV